MPDLFYKSIADYYDFIFPANDKQAAFITDQTQGDFTRKALLEIGCGTGNLCCQLATQCKHVTAIDRDSSMIQKAQAKAAKARLAIEFLDIDMLQIEKAINRNRFDVLVCFGNTLAHLASLHEMNDFLQQAHSLLRPNGHIFLQIVNFNRILDQGIHSLPLIDNDHVRFERFYAHRNSQNLIDFRTILTVKSNNIKIENVTALYPLQRDELEGLLQKTGFQNIRFFGTFAKNTWTNTRMATIVEATN